MPRLLNKSQIQMSPQQSCGLSTQILVLHQFQIETLSDSPFPDNAFIVKLLMGRFLGVEHSCYAVELIKLK